LASPRSMIYRTKLFFEEKGGEQGADDVLKYEQSEMRQVLLQRARLFHYPLCVYIYMSPINRGNKESHKPPLIGVVNTY